MVLSCILKGGNIDRLVSVLWSELQCRLTRLGKLEEKWGGDKIQPLCRH